jgi:NAD(P)-dependent dehydrogenase (short-subunit alcohol dehydrogenase family)
MAQPFQLNHRKALVTGGASGIGEHTVRVLHNAGADVIVADLNPDTAQRLAASLGERASALQLDVTDPLSVEAAFSSLGKLDILVNNAGIGHVGGLEETAIADWQKVFRVNVEGV